MDLLIDATYHFLNNDAIDMKQIFDDRFDKIQIFYSTPERYTQCKHADIFRRTSQSGEAVAFGAEGTNKVNSINFNVKTGDFFPYADCDHCYWTGFFTSRQGLKRLERVGSSFLHAARQIQSIRKLQGGIRLEIEGQLESDSDIESELVPSLKAWNNSPLYKLDDAMGVAQHHDAVAGGYLIALVCKGFSHKSLILYLTCILYSTGTSKQHVAYDYAKQISEGIGVGSAFVTQMLRELLLNRDESSHGLLENLSYCHMLNETTCAVSQVS